jgi:hypothetical protein
MKRLLVLFALAAFLSGCNGNDSGNSKETGTDSKATTTESTTTPEGNPSYDPERGAGKFTKVDLPANLDPAMSEQGEKVYSVKCSGCHKVTNEKLVGPGWQGVTIRHKPEWIMNFVTNPDEMLDKDPKAKAMLEICLVRMPNQNVADDEARQLLEFMRKIDGVK